ncbi:hypothetical protein KEM56_006343 [Ascosphaera pollenicola]|nr:hypothetical protein KEM56_006343 [Ascosphaera pollenicola]
MAFLQPVQNGNGVPGDVSLPPNLTPLQINEIWQKYRRMQEQNVRQDDPEFIQTHNLLLAIQNNHTLQKQLQKQRQLQQRHAQMQTQHQRQQQLLPGNQPLNPQHTGQNDASASTTVPEDRKNSMQASPNMSAGPSPITGPGQKSAGAHGASFTAEQLSILKNQIFAFRYLSKNLPVPSAVQQQLALTGKPQSATSAPAESQPASAAEDTAEGTFGATETAATAAPAAGSVDIAKQLEAKPYYDTFESPYKAIAESISYFDHSFRRNRPRIPAITPVGIDLDRVQYEREVMLYNQLNARKTELAQVPANLETWRPEDVNNPSQEDSLKLKALIEYKMLSLFPKQRMLRKQIQTEMFHFDNLAMTANRAKHRRMKKQSLREARVTEKLEQQQRDARATKEKKKQSDQLQAILTHGQNIRTSGNEHRMRIQKLGRMMLQHHQHMEKEEQKRVERTAKQRLQALKANDEETYMKLLGQAKDSRISHLLKQTDGFLRQLASSVRQQQRNTAERYGDEPFEEPVSDEEDEDDEGTGGRVDYYSVAHRVKEEVSQPAMLVGGTLKEYQIRGLEWMISLYNNNLNGILADEMGLGKTIQTISLITYLIERKQQHGPFLVIVPLSTLTNWNMEFEKWAPSVTKIVYKGPPAQRKTQQSAIRYGNFQVLLTTYEYIIKDRNVLSKIKWLHMIVDEGHRMKNASSKLSSTLTQFYTTRYRLILTGTPLQNNLPELWALLNFVLPNIFKSVKSFDEWFNTPFANTGGQDRMELTEEEQLLVIRRLHKVLRPFLLRRLKKDVERDLPDKQERVIKCRFSALQAKINKQLANNNRLVVGDGKGGKTGLRGLSNMLMQLRKLCNHPFVFESVEDDMNPGRGTNDLIWRSAGKFELLDRILPKFKASGHRVLIFFQMTQIMNIMEDFLRYRGFKYLRLDGSTKSDDRSELLKLFNDPESDYFCFLLSTRAGGLGLNLQTADTVIIYDSDWNPHQDLQAQDRAHRIGQKNEVRILRLITANSVEQRILERAQFKLDMDGKVIQAGKFDNKSTNEERDALLRTLLETAETADQVGDQDEMDDDDLNDIMARSADELTLFQKLDSERIATQAYGPGHKYPRLLCEEELPEIYLQEDNPVAEESHEVFGRGARERKVTKYDDGLTEEQWLMAVDADDDSIEAAIARKEARDERRKANKDRRGRKTQDSESPEPEREPSVSPPPPASRRGRGRRAQSKRKAEEPIEKPTQPKRKRGRQSKAFSNDKLNPERRESLQKALSHVYQALMNFEQEIQPDTSDEEDGATEPIMRSIIDPFMKPPPKTQYPDYYVVIQNPIAMDTIKKKINKEEYRSLKQFKDDIKLLCDNARTYNEDSSLLFQDANDIEALAVSELKKQAEKYPELGSIDSDTPEEQSVAPSVADTPATGQSTPAIASGPKLKLTFNTGGGNYKDTSAAPGANNAEGDPDDDEDF